MSVLPFFASMSSQASVFLGKGMAAQTELLRSPIFKWFCYKLNNEVTMLIIFNPTLSRAAFESQSDFLWWTPLDGYGLGLQNRRTCVDKIFCELQSESWEQPKFREKVTFWTNKKLFIDTFYHYSPLSNVENSWASHHHHLHICKYIIDYMIYMIKPQFTNYWQGSPIGPGELRKLIFV